MTTEPLPVEIVQEPPALPAAARWLAIGCIFIGALGCLAAAGYVSTVVKAGGSMALLGLFGSGAALLLGVAYLARLCIYPALVLGGVGLLGRRRWGRPLLVGSAWLLAATSSTITVLIQFAVYKSMPSQHYWHEMANLPLRVVEELAIPAMILLVLHWTRAGSTNAGGKGFEPTFTPRSTS